MSKSLSRKDYQDFDSELAALHEKAQPTLLRVANAKGVNSRLARKAGQIEKAIQALRLELDTQRLYEHPR